MDFIIWSQILYELAFSVSGEQNLDKLMKKAAFAFLKKLDCAHVSILRWRNRRLEPAHVIPRVTLKDPAYYELIGAFEILPLHNGDGILSIQEKGLHYYGFPLPRFGLLLLGKSDPVEEALLKELLPITGMLAQNCFFNLDAIRKRRAVEIELEKERHLLREIIDAIPDLVFYKDVHGVYKIINRATANFLSRSPEEIIGHPAQVVHSPSEANKCRKTDVLAIQSGRVQRYETQLKHYDDHPFPFETIKAPIYDAEGECIGTVSVCRDITFRKHYERQLEYVGAHDQLTALYNRRFLEKEISRLDTAQQLPLSIIMGDLNGLKLTNDVFGHREGDNLIVQAARLIRKACREGDLISRWGGDEFMIILPRSGAESAGEVCRRIKDRCRAYKCGPLQISIALGWATKNRAEENIWQVLKEASDNMYSDKFLNARDYEKTVVNSLRSALFNKSIETEEHVERLKAVCQIVGIKIGLSKRQLSDLDLLAGLHNIGKVAIDRNILKKTGPLTDTEWAQLKKHPEIGYRFARAVPELTPVCEYILAHHERWDGKGYPRGIKGDDIPLLSRILAVADAYDAMTHSRPYRKAISHQEALADLKRNAGKQFDPEIVDVLCQLDPVQIKSCPH